MVKKFRLPLAIATFVLLDLGTLAFSYTIAVQVEKDAVAINLAGRQRMLSQRVTKAALLATDSRRSEAERLQSATEVTGAYAVFQRTLTAFSQGGETLGGDGQPVLLESVDGKAALLVGEVRSLLEPWQSAPRDATEMVRFAQFMVDRNGEILDDMNQLTTALEHQSVAAVSRLRIAQSFAFLLSLLNFVFILRGLHGARKVAELQSITDGMTGLLNRGGFYAALRDATTQSQESNAPLGVMLLDLDGFKAVNDTYGHAQGDDTLLEVARRSKTLASRGWICGRLGGDEFAIICPGLDVVQLAQAGQQVGDLLASVPAGDLVVSASVGWASAQPQSRVDDLVAAADAMMYDVKNMRHQQRSHRDRDRNR